LKSDPSRKEIPLGCTSSAPRPRLCGFASSEKVHPTPPTPLPSHHPAPSILPTVAATVLLCEPARSETAPIVAPGAPTLTHTVPALHTDTSPVLRALVPFHEGSSVTVAIPARTTRRPRRCHPARICWHHRTQQCQCDRAPLTERQQRCETVEER